MTKTKPTRWLNSSQKGFKVEEDRRQFERIPAGAEARLLVLRAQQRTLCCRIENVSVRGCRVTVSEPISSGTPVMIAVCSLWLMGEVVYCHTLPQGYALGIELEQQLDLAAMQEILGQS